MSLSQNSLCVVENSVNYNNGLSLKSRVLKKTLKEKNISLSSFANLLGINRKRLRCKLFHHRKFSKEQITKIVYLFGAYKSVEILWFCSLQEKKRVKKAIGEKKMLYDKETDNCFESETIRVRNKIFKDDESDYYDFDNWEQTEGCENMMLDSNVLPSRKFYRRRK